MYGIFCIIICALFIGRVKSIRAVANGAATSEEKTVQPPTSSPTSNALMCRHDLYFYTLPIINLGVITYGSGCILTFTQGWSCSQPGLDMQNK